jgi:uncharacterized membrane protein YphA (DoxX/SURF4 family)
MIDAGTFAWLTGCSALVVAVTLLLIRSEAIARRLARGLYLYTIAISSVTLVVTAVRSSGVARMSALTGLPFQILLYRGWLVVGAGVSAVAILAVRAYRSGGASPAPTPSRSRSRRRRAADIFAASPDLLRALVVSVTLSFIAVEIGKLAHDADMRQFFLQSGYPAWFHDVVMGLETLGALALLVPTLRIPAAAGLCVLMVGAIQTHHRNGDPVTDSLEAIHLLILLVCIILIIAGRTRMGDGLREPAQCSEVI